MGHSIGHDANRGHFARSAPAGRADHLYSPGHSPAEADGSAQITPCGRAFFELQIEFAGRAARLAGTTVDEAVLRYTNCYIRFGLGRDFDAAHPVWQEYARGLRATVDPAEWTFRFYRSRPPELGLPVVAATSGCFSYGWMGEDRVRLHFRNAETDGRSPLGADRERARREELTALFAHVKREERRPIQVVGASWLYNLTAYRRLFPDRYLATARPLHGRFRHMPLWGQFLDRRGEVRAAEAAVFRERLARASTVEELERCFPLPVLGLEAPVSDFYEHYRL